MRKTFLLSVMQEKPFLANITISTEIQQRTIGNDLVRIYVGTRNPDTSFGQFRVHLSIGTIVAPLGNV